MERSEQERQNLIENLKKFRLSNDSAEGLADAIISYFKPSENIGQLELVKEITRIIQSNCGTPFCKGCESDLDYPALDYDMAESTAYEIATLLSSSPSGENGDMVSKEEMFDFIRWLREADRFNGGRSLKMVYEDFSNAKNK